MSCNINRDNKGNIINVLDDNGNESKLFNQIAKFPHIESLEEAVSIYDEVLKANPNQTEINDGFYSNTLRALSKIKDKNVKNVKGWINQLTDVQKTGERNVRQELDWIGLEDYLNEWAEENKPKNNNIPFDVIKEYVEDNQIGIVEVSKGDTQDVVNKVERLENKYNVSINIDEHPMGEGVVYDVTPQEDSLSDKEYINLQEKVEKELKIGISPSKYETYQLEGGENYREILLTLPYINRKENYIKKKIIPAKDTIVRKYDSREEGTFIDFYSGQKKHYKYKVAIEKSTGDIYSVVEGKHSKQPSKDIALRTVENALAETLSDKIVYIPFVNGKKQSDGYAEKKQAENLIKNFTEEKGYKSSHWDESNILAHIRLNERTLLNGDRTLFIEEIQSDWAQDGKKKGFKPLKKTPIDDDLRSSARKVIVEMSNLGFSTKAEARNAILENQDFVSKFNVEAQNAEILTKWKEYNIKRKADKYGTPDMPYKKTDQWVGMAMRKVYQMAAQEGFDRVAWVTGEQSADRYDLSKQVENIDVQPRENGDKFVFINMASAYNITLNVGQDGVIKEGQGNLDTNTNFIGKSLSDIVGKELAEKILGFKVVTKEDFNYSDNITNDETGEKGVGYLQGKDVAVWARTKEAADKHMSRILKNAEANSSESIRGNDLKVGGEGMKTFYNSIVPKVAKKEAQRFDKSAKVEVVEISSGVRYTPPGEFLKFPGAVLDAIDNYEESEEKGKNEEEILRKELDNLNYSISFDQAGDIYGVAKKEVAQSKQLSVPITDKMRNTLATSAIPMFNLESGGTKYESFKQALDNTEEKTIEIVSNGKVVATIPTTLDERTKEGVVNSFILDGILSPNKVTFNGKTYYQTTGDTYQDRKLSTEFFKDEIKTVLNKRNYKITEGLIELIDKKVVPPKEGTIARTVIDKVAALFSGKTILPQQEKVNERNLKLNLMTILSDMGVSVISLKDYTEKFKKKNNNVAPNANALADIANRVIAFKDGQLTLENLTEEVMHFIVETLPNEEIASLEDFIRESAEYQEHYEAYNKVYKGDKNQIDKEILGKILMNIALKKTAGKSKTFVGKLYDILKNFFNNLKLTSKQRTDLKHLNGLVEKLVFQREGNFTEDSLSNSKQVALMYNLTEEVIVTQDVLRKSFKNLSDFKQFGSFNRELSKDLDENKLRGKQLTIAVAAHLEKANQLIEVTEAALKTAEKQGTSLTGQNLAIYYDLIGEVQPSLSSLSNELINPPEGVNKQEASILSEKIQESASRIIQMGAENKKLGATHSLRIAKEIAKEMNVEESEYFIENIQKVIDGKVEDVNLIFSYFGQLHHSSNPVLNLISTKLQEMGYAGNQGLKEDISEFLNFMEENNVSQKQLAELVKDGFWRDKWDHKAFNDALLNADMEAYNSITGENYADIEKYKADKREENLIQKLEGGKYGEYISLKDQKQYVLSERRMDSNYYEEQYLRYGNGGTLTLKNGKTKQIKGLNISSVAQAFIKDMSNMRASIKAQATQTYFEKDKEGNIIKKERVVLSPQQKDNLNAISKTRKKAKDIFNIASLKKSGLETSLDKPEGESVLLPTGQYLYLSDNFESLSEVEQNEALVAFDLHKLDDDYKTRFDDNIEKETTGINFLNYITKLSQGKFGPQTPEQVKEVIIANIGVSLSQEYYDTMNGDSFIKGDILEKLNTDENGVVNPRVKEVKENYAKRNALLSNHRNTTTPFEIDRLTPTEQLTIKILTEDITQGLRGLNTPKREVLDQEESVGEKSVNLSYLNELKNKGITPGSQDELRFLSAHSDTSSMGNFENAYNKSQSGITLGKSESRLLKNHLKPTLLESKISYAKSRLYPYYTRYTPVGYKSMESRLNAGENPIIVLDEVLNKSPYLDVRIDNSFEDGESPFKNEAYRDDFDGGFIQPKKGTFLDQEFINRFGINEAGEATKEVNLHKALRLYIDTVKKGLDKYNEKGHNPYKAIQVSATNTEKVRKFAEGITKGKVSSSIGVVKEMIKDTISYRVDDVARGADNFETNRNLPKYYLRDLESKEDVSTDYIFALAQFSARANDYKAKKDVMADIDSLHNTIVQSKGSARSKEFKNTIAMSQSAIDGNIFGKLESQSFEVKVPGINDPVDLSKIVRVLRKLSTILNLGFSIISPLTGLMSGSYVKLVEEIIGDKLNKDASKLATKEFKKLMGQGAKNAFEFNDNSKIFKIGQWSGIFDLSRKTRNAKYNQLQRAFSKSALGAFSIADYPIKPRIVLAVLFDHRIVEDKVENKIVGKKIQNQRQFLQEGLRKGLSEKDLLVSWRALEDKAVYNFMDFSDTGFNWKKGTGLTKEQLESRRRVIQTDITEQVSQIDGQISPEIRTQAQRNALLSTTLQHKSFLTILAANRLKDTHLDVTRGQLSEGTWRTAAKVLKETFSTDGDFKGKLNNLMNSMQKKEDESYLEFDLRVRNIRRLSTEVGSYAVLAMIISTFLLATDDEEEDGYLESLSSLLLMRTLNESASSLSFNTLSDYGSTIESPIVMYNTAKTLLPVWNALDFREIEDGKYKGMTKSERYFINNTPSFKSILDMSSAKTLQDKQKTYENFNKGAMLNASSLFVIPIIDSFDNK